MSKKYGIELGFLNEAVPVMDRDIIKGMELYDLDQRVGTSG